MDKNYYSISDYAKITLHLSHLMHKLSFIIFFPLFELTEVNSKRFALWAKANPRWRRVGDCIR